MELAECKDYRDFLNARYEALKKRSKKVSFQSYALRYGTSRAYLKNVISKKRHLSLDAIESVTDFLQLSRLEAEYVLYQFLMSQSHNEKVKEHFAEMLALLLGQSLMTELPPKTGKPAIAASEKSWLLAHLKEAVLATLASQPDFREDYDWIQALLPDSMKFEVTEFESALSEIKKRNLLGEVQSDQRYQTRPAELDHFKQGLRAVEATIDRPLQHRPSHFEMGVVAMTDAQYKEIVSDLQKIVLKIDGFSNVASQTETRVFVTSFSICCVAKSASEPL
jgi:uncharacterized protein (TIGR02147 family)